MCNLLEQSFYEALLTERIKFGAVLAQTIEKQHYVINDESLNAIYRLMTQLNYSEQEMDVRFTNHLGQGLSTQLDTMDKFYHSEFGANGHYIVQNLKELIESASNILLTCRDNMHD